MTEVSAPERKNYSMIAPEIDSQIIGQDSERIWRQIAQLLIASRTIATAKDCVATVCADIDAGIALTQFNFGFAVKGLHSPAWMFEVGMEATATGLNVWA